MTKVFSLISADWIKALMMSVLVPVVGYVFTVVNSGSFMINWHQVALMASSSFLGYIIKNLGTSTTITGTVTPMPGTPALPVILTEKVMGITLPQPN